MQESEICGLLSKPRTVTQLQYIESFLNHNLKMSFKTDATLATESQQRIQLLLILALIFFSIYLKLFFVQGGRLDSLLLQLVGCCWVRGDPKLSDMIRDFKPTARLLEAFLVSSVAMKTVQTTDSGVVLNPVSGTSLADIFVFVFLNNEHILKP